MSRTDPASSAVAAVVVALVGLTACKKGPPAPVDIPDGEACASCRMAISERVFASEIVRGDGTAEFFDDAGCLLSALDRRPLAEGDASYVADFATGAWVDLHAAIFVRARSVHTPMGSGVMAFTTREAAAAAAARHDGVIHGLGELRAGGPRLP